MNLKIYFNKNKNIFILFAIFIFALLIRIIYSTFLKGVGIYPDSSGYISAAKDIANLKLSAARTPIYPLFIQIAWKVFPFVDSNVAVTMLQSVFSSFTVVLAFLISKRIFKEISKSIIYTLYCSISVCIINWDFIILTESLTIFLITALVFSFTMYFESGRKLHLILIFLLNFVLVYTKPVYMLLCFLTAFVLIAHGIFNKKLKPTIIISVISIAVILSSELAYSYINYKQNDYFGISNTGAVNYFGKVLRYNMYGMGKEGRIKDMIDKEVKVDPSVTYSPYNFVDKYELYKNNYSEINSFSLDIIYRHPLIYLQKTCQLVQNHIENFLLSFNVFVDYNNLWLNDHYNYYNNYKSIIPTKLFEITNGLPLIFNFPIILLVLLIEIVIILFKGFRKIVNWNIAVIILICLYQFIMTVFLAFGEHEYNRFFSPVYGLLILILFKYLFSFTDKINKSINKIFKSNN